MALALILMYLACCESNTVHRMKAENLDIIKDFEGLKLTAYKCPAGKWTIGFGHTRNVSPGDTITEAQAVGYLYNDVRKIERFINGYDLDLNQNQFDALVSFGFNVGIGNLKRSTLFKKVRQDPDDITIYTEFTRWVRANGKPLRGLLKRRIAEANLYFEGRI